MTKPDFHLIKDWQARHQAREEYALKRSDTIRKWCRNSDIQCVVTKAPRVGRGRRMPVTRFRFKRNGRTIDWLPYDGHFLLLFYSRRKIKVHTWLDAQKLLHQLLIDWKDAKELLK